MAPRQQILAKVNAAAVAFAEQVASIVSLGVQTDIVERLRRELDGLRRNGAPDGAARGSGSRRAAAGRARTATSGRRPVAGRKGAAIDQLVAVIREAGGVAEPRHVSMVWGSRRCSGAGSSAPRSRPVASGPRGRSEPRGTSCGKPEEQTRVVSRTGAPMPTVPPSWTERPDAL